MYFRNQLAKAILPILRLAPHNRITLPYPRDPQIRLSFYPDTELGLWLGYNEPSVIKWWKTNVDDSTVVYDIGAHIGIYSLLAAVRGAEVHAFEPDNNAVSRIRDQAATNDVTDSILVNESVVSDTDCEVSFYKDGSGRRHSLLDSRTSDREVTVDSTTLDTYASAHQIPDIIKIDIEGAGDMLLAGAESVHSSSQITWLFEVHNDTEQAAIDEYFSTPNYTSNWISDRHVVVLPSSE
jgi:FkbM family methyltransferase